MSSPDHGDKGLPPSSFLYYSITMIVIAGVAAALWAAALGPLRDTFWGFHLYAFMPTLVGALSWALLIAAALWLLRPAASAGSALSFRAQTLVERHPWLISAALAVVFTVCFWAFRSQQDLLGDAVPLTRDLPLGQVWHPRQPLTMWLQQWLYQNFAGIFAGEGIGDDTVASHVVAAGSIAAGFFFVVAVSALTRRFAHGTHQHGGTALLAALVLLTQGYMLLFFGYVENYTYYTLAIALYLLTSVMFLQGRLTIQVPILVFVVTLGLHLSAIILLPSLAILFFVGLRTPGRRLNSLVGGVILVAAMIGMAALLHALSPRFNLLPALRDLFRVANVSHGGGAGLGYIFSSLHFRDFMNEQFLIGPLAAFLFVPALALATKRRDLKDPTTLFLCVSAGAFLFGSWMTSEPLLGYARDWDLFAPAAVCYTAAGLFLMLRHVASTVLVNRLLAFALIFSLLHLTPWVRINHSELLALNRFATLPLGFGRTEVTVGNWFYRRGRMDEAVDWFQRAVQVNPNNANAHGFLGMIYAQRELDEIAREEFEKAVALRPDKLTLRHNYAMALISTERYEEALVQLDWLLQREPESLQYWTMAGEALAILGREEEMLEAHRRTLQLLDREIAASPADPILHMQAGIILSNFGDFSAALKRYQRALALAPNDANPLFYTAMCFIELGRPAEARPLLEKVERLHPDHPQIEWIRAQLGEP